MQRSAKDTRHESVPGINASTRFSSRHGCSKRRQRYMPRHSHIQALRYVLSRHSQNSAWSEPQAVSKQRVMCSWVAWRWRCLRTPIPSVSCCRLFPRQRPRPSSLPLPAPLPASATFPFFASSPAAASHLLPPASRLRPPSICQLLKCRPPPTALPFCAFRAPGLTHARHWAAARRPQRCPAAPPRCRRLL